MAERFWSRSLAIALHRSTASDLAGGTAEQTEISRLRAELARVTMERDILGWFHRELWAPVRLQGLTAPVSSTVSLGYTSGTKRRQDVSRSLCEQSRQWPLLQPVDVQHALGKEPGAIDLHEGVGVSERGDHQAFLLTVDSDVMRQAVGFACCAVALQREECTLSNEMRCGVVLVQVGKDRSEFLSRMQLL